MLDGFFVHLQDWVRNRILQIKAQFTTNIELNFDLGKQYALTGTCLSEHLRLQLGFLSSLLTVVVHPSVNCDFTDIIRESFVDCESICWRFLEECSVLIYLLIDWLCC